MRPNLWVIIEVIVEEAVPLDFQGMIQCQFELGVVPPLGFQLHRHLIGHLVKGIA